VGITDRIDSDKTENLIVFEEMLIMLSLYSPVLVQDLAHLLIFSLLHTIEPWMAKRVAYLQSVHGRTVL